MSPDAIAKLVTDSAGIIVVPWVIWVTVSLFNQRQELALLRQIVTELKDMVKHRQLD